MPSPTKPALTEVVTPSSPKQFLVNNGYLCGDRKEREGLLHKDECLKLEDIRIHENLLVNVPTSTPTVHTPPIITRRCSSGHLSRMCQDRRCKYIVFAAVGFMLGMAVVMIYNQPTSCLPKGQKPQASLLGGSSAEMQRAEEPLSKREQRTKNRKLR